MDEKGLNGIKTRSKHYLKLYNFANGVKYAYNLTGTPLHPPAFRPKNRLFLRNRVR